MERTIDQTFINHLLVWAQFLDQQDLQAVDTVQLTELVRYLQPLQVEV